MHTFVPLDITNGLHLHVCPPRTEKVNAFEKEGVNARTYEGPVERPPMLKGNNSPLLYIPHSRIAFLLVMSGNNGPLLYTPHSRIAFLLVRDVAVAMEGDRRVALTTRLLCALGCN